MRVWKNYLPPLLVDFYLRVASAKGMILFLAVYLVASLSPSLFLSPFSISGENQRGNLISLRPSVEFIFSKIKRGPAST